LDDGDDVSLNLAPACQALNLAPACQALNLAPACQALLSKSCVLQHHPDAWTTKPAMLEKKAMLNTNATPMHAWVPSTSNFC
jgi:hypothetical protein